MYELLELYLKENKLIKQHLDSYNKFVNEGMQKIVDTIGVIETDIPGCKLILGKIHIEKPMTIESDSSLRAIYPMECRIRNLTYSGRIFLEIKPIINEIERKPVTVYIGDLPVMVKSNVCYLSGMSKSELISAGEDPLDPGGYFIINGTERVLVGIEDLAANKIMTTREKKGVVISKVFSTRFGFRSRCAVTRNKLGYFEITFPASPPKLDLALVLRSLGLSDEEIIESFESVRKGEKSLINDALLNLEALDVKTKSEAIEKLGKMAAPLQPKEFRDKRVDTLLDLYLLPHLGIEPGKRKLKGEYLCRMAARATLVANKKYPADDKDHYSNKRIKLSGVLMEELFRYAFQFLVKDIAYQAERTAARGRRIQDIKTFVRPEAFSERVRYAMATGNWIGGQTGVCQLLDRTSFSSTLSHLRRIISPLSRVHPHFEARDLHGTHFGRICPIETPEGTSCSLVKNMALYNEVTIGIDEKEVEGILKKLGVKSL
jgi:DNA-directed RNA polymerase subunit B